MNKFHLLYVLLVLCASVAAFDVTLNAPQNITYSNQIDLDAQATAEVTWQFSINNAPNVTIGTGSAASYDLSEVDGVNKLELTASSGNETKSTTVYFTVDLNSPSSPVLNGVENQGQTSLTWTAAVDTISSISNYLIFRDEVNIANTSNLFYSENVVQGSYAYYVKAMDSTGKLSPASNVQVLISGNSEVLTSQISNYIYDLRSYAFQATSPQSLSQVNLVLNSNSYAMQLVQSNTYAVNLPNLKAGDYTYYVQGNLINGSLVVSGSKTFSISKATPQLTLTLNSSTSNISAVQGDFISVYSYTSTKYSVPLKLKVSGQVEQVIQNQINTTIQVIDSQNLTAFVEFAGDENYTSESKYIGIQVGKDETAPEFLSFNSKVTDKTSILEWTTNEPATSRIDYGITTEMLQLYLKSDFSTSQSVTLENLSTLTTYYFTITSCDRKNNCNSIVKKTFTTNTPAAAVETQTVPVTNLNKDAALRETEKPAISSSAPVVNSAPIQKDYTIDFIGENGEIVSLTVNQKITKSNGKKLVEFSIQSPSDLGMVSVSLDSAQEVKEISDNGVFDAGKITWNGIELKAQSSKMVSFAVNENTDDSKLTSSLISLARGNANPSGSSGFAVKSEHLTIGSALVLLIFGSLAAIKLRKKKLTFARGPPVVEVKQSNPNFRVLKRQVFEH